MILRYLLTQFSKLPFGVLYAISDIVFVLVYHVVGYRKDVVHGNISSSFPEKTAEEIKKIEKDFYHWFCDYIFETIKLLSISSEELLEHLEVRGCEEAVALSEKTGQEVAAFLGHHGNWEWMTAVGLVWPKRERDTVIGLIYHPLNNKTMDDIMIKARSSHGGTCIPKKDILRELVRCRRDKLHYLFGYILDQSPKWENIHLWLDFMGHESGVFTGAERIARKMNDIVVFAHFERPKRGKYVVTFEIVNSDLGNTEEFDVTKKCFELLEQDIRRTPHIYLWTHNRWKRTREGYEKWKERHNIKW